MDFCQSEPVFNKVQLYQPDQLTFNHHTSVAPTTVATTTTITENSNNNNHPDLNNNNAKNNPLATLDDSASTSPSWTPPSYELQEMLIHYQSQPDLLQLILESKLQEDKRRTEEARLRAKELDLMLLQHQQLHRNSFTTTSLLSEMTSTTTSSSSIQNNRHINHHHDFSKRRHSSLNNITENSSDELNDVMFLQQLTSSFPDSSTNDNNNKNDTQGSLASSYPLNELYHPHDPLITTNPSSSTTTTTITNMTTPTTPSSSSTISTSSSLSPPSPSTPNSSLISSSSNDNHQKPRKRREMQAITKLVETREFPYLDGYFWRNNGNTIQKKTGNKSVYYKCSNSSKNCTVNKTILFKENGEFLIKYRGEHLPECGKVQHIVDV